MRKIILLLLVTWSCFSQSIQKDNNAFALSLYLKLDQKDTNIVFSPYGIFSNLALLYFGAQGKTADQIKNVLHLSTTDEHFLKTFHKHLNTLLHPTDNGYQLLIANGLFPHKGTHFLNQFKETATNIFDAKLQSVDYDIPDSTLETINGWISTKTGGKIPELIEESDLSTSTRLIVTNGVYFQGEWEHPFDPQKTTLAPFHLTSEDFKKTPMLKQLQKFPYFENKDIQCLALPFMRKNEKQSLLQCILILPKTSLKEIEHSLNTQTFDKWILSCKPTLIEAHIPKFCFSQRFLLNESLKQLGMRDAFTYLANFSKIDGMKDLFINKALHETFFSFDENGVVAASATASQLGLTSIPPGEKTPISFNADHPFLFFIIDYPTRTILFMGRVVNPSLDFCTNGRSTHSTMDCMDCDEN